MMIKAQSAMEYLMTYGWAILIISVVLGALFSLGVFSGSSMLGTSCIAAPGYLCQNPVLSTSGTLTFLFGQNIGAPVYNAILWVAPQSTVPTSTPPSFGFTNSNAGSNTLISNPFQSGQTVNVSVSLSGILGSSPAIGTPFSGYVWLVYNSTGSTGTRNLITKVATIIVKVS
ncbi:MAG: hypothetical protein ACP5HW_00500 [Candidatus Micrarchaeia archaeon]